MRPRRHISITASGSATCRPDVCVVVLYIQGHGSTIGAATDHCEKITERVLENVRGSHSTLMAVKTSTVFTGESAEDSLAQSLRGPQKVRHTKKLYITLPADAALAQRVADTALVSGANLAPLASGWSREVRSAILYSCAEFDAIRQQALEAAIAAAQRDAEKLAQALGMQCGGILSVVQTMSPDELHANGWYREDPLLPILWDRAAQSSEELRVLVRVRVDFELLAAA